MPVAEIIAIGTELLLGEIQDTNTRYLARTLKDEGIDLYRASMVGDNTERIARTIREAMTRAQVIITTGGLGPTVDDPTRLAVAHSVGVDIEFHPELWEQIQARFQRLNRPITSNNQKQAYLPKGALAIENAVGTAPAFVVDTGNNVIISLPGVPREMEYLIQNKVLPYLRDRFQIHSIIKTYVIHTAGVSESQIDEWVGDLEELFNPTVGLAAHSGQIDIRITAKAETAGEADELIEGLAKRIRQQLGEHIYGINEETLASVIADHLKSTSRQMVLLMNGLGDQPDSPLAAIPASVCRVVPIPDHPGDHQQLLQLIEQRKPTFEGKVIAAISLQPMESDYVLSLAIDTGSAQKSAERKFSGPALSMKQWGTNMALDFIRRNL
ncbi:MAG TPA: CinA family nicotinamide mononucleotide deamidase-related protein [Longilinea sp.]|nr:CinA family nicotinamide mononucleotide deamidase-related protein [Longilinea sp.]